MLSKQTTAMWLSQQARHIRKNICSLPKVRIWVRGRKRNTDVALQVTGSFSRVCLALTLTTLNAWKPPKAHWVNNHSGGCFGGRKGSMVLFIIIIINMTLQNIFPARNDHSKISNHQNEHESWAQLAYTFWKGH